MATSFFTLSCLHELGLGALLAWISLYSPVLLKKLGHWYWLYLAGGFYLVSLLIQNYFELAWYKEILDEFFFSIFAVFIISRASQNRFKLLSKFILENRFIVYSGKISYGLYVYHLFVGDLFYYIAPRIGLSISNKYTAFIAFYFLAFLIAHISWKYIESPINSLKDKFPYIRNKAHSTALINKEAG